MDESRPPLDPPPALAIPEAVADELNRLWTVSRAFANTAHELNNGLQIIGGQAEMLGLAVTTPDAQRRLREIVGAVTRSAADLEALLRYARLRPAHPQVQDAGSLIRACVQMRTASLARRRITMATPDLPDRCRAIVDAAWFMQLLLDLLFACEDAAARGRAGAMAVEAQPVAGGLRICVEARWQEPAVPPAGEREPDLGGGALPLAVARRLADRLGGSLAERCDDGRVVLELTVPAPPA